ncbi:MAG: hypothetical protein CL840_05040 [Crocinitomicaceae bacterium]|nr:hypothetical protein [Crocinitomicaceae bacterium]|tara:strand:+ start:2248 stop:2568 length:321 start_codon:yes stop_codon:yes gene_type:complete
MTTLAKEQAALAKGQGKLKKFLAAVKKLFAKEFLWVLAILLLALPMATIFTYLLQKYAPKPIMDDILGYLKGTSLFIAAYAFSIAGIYFTRTVVGAIETLVKKEEG